MMAKSNMNQDILKVLLSEEQLHQRIQEMGDEHAAECQLHHPVRP